MSAAPPTPRTESAQTLSLSVGRGEGTPLCGWREDRDKLTAGHIRKEIFA